jgi:SRSO17 transposase
MSRAVWDEQQVLNVASAWAARHLDDGDAVLIVNEPANEKSSVGCVGAARQYSGAVGGIALRQVAVTLTYVTGRGHALIGRALYLPGARAADEEHRELGGVPEEVKLATKPQLADALPGRAHSLGIRAAFVADYELYGGRELRPSIREREMSYAMAVRANHAPGRRLRPRRDLRRRRQDDSRPRLALDAHRLRDQGQPSLRLGDARRDQRRHHNE